MATSQTSATERYRKKAGIISKNFKLPKAFCDEYAAACEKAGVSQTAQIMKMMQAFIDEQNNAD